MQFMCLIYCFFLPLWYFFTFTFLAVVRCFGLVLLRLLSFLFLEWLLCFNCDPFFRANLESILRLDFFGLFVSFCNPLRRFWAVLFVAAYHALKPTLGLIEVVCLFLFLGLHNASASSTSGSSPKITLFKSL